MKGRTAELIDPRNSGKFWSSDGTRTNRDEARVKLITSIRGDDPAILVLCPPQRLNLCGAQKAFVETKGGGNSLGVFMNFDRMVGKDFEQGLTNLKALAEK